MEMQSSLENQIALVCGATGRVGSQIARVLAAHGATTILQYRQNAAAAQRLVDEIASDGGNAIAFSAEVSDESSVMGLVDEIHERFGGLHLLVNAVHGQFDPKPVAEMTWSDWDVHLEALKGHFHVCQAVLPVMRAQHYGRIVYISGGLARRYFKGCSAYTTIKAGLNGFCKTLAIEEGENGITVNIVAPGKVVPSDGRESTDHPLAWKDLNQQSIVNNPLGRHATSEDVAQAVLYFASPAAAGITGQTLFVAGGEIMP